MTAYRVTAPVVVAQDDTAHGRAMSYFYAGTFLPAGVPSKTVEHLLRRRMIEPVDDGRALEPIEDAVVSPAEGDGDQSQDSVPFDAPERVAAREKLPADGSLPDGRAGHPVWVEAAVRAGYAYDAASKSNKKELQDLLAK